MPDYLMKNYAPLPVTFTKGEGAILWDADNNQYLDALSGVAVCSLGHAHPDVAMAIAKQAITHRPSRTQRLSIQSDSRPAGS